MDLTSRAERLDEHTWALYLQVDGAQVVLLQALFETYEGLGTVRTLDIRKSLVCILTTPPQLKDCCGALESMRGEIEWRVVPRPPEADNYLGYFTRSRQ